MHMFWDTISDIILKKHKVNLENWCAAFVLMKHLSNSEGAGRAARNLSTAEGRWRYPAKNKVAISRKLPLALFRA